MFVDCSIGTTFAGSSIDNKLYTGDIMKRNASLLMIIVIFLLLWAVSGCDKERIVESTEYVQEIEYIYLPPDTIVQTDTVFNSDTSVVYFIDTAFVFDTVIQVYNNYDTVSVYVYDTVSTVQNHYDTTYIIDTVSTVYNHYDTTYLIDTVLQVINNYDTVTIIDTVQTTSNAANEHTALGALEYYSDPIVIEAINAEFGYTDGWILYLSTYQVALDNPTANVFDVYGYIDYWAPDWSGYYTFEYLWRLTYTGGDPAVPTNWQMTEPPTAVSGHQPGLNVIQNPDKPQTNLR